MTTPTPRPTTDNTELIAEARCRRPRNRQHPVHATLAAALTKQTTNQESTTPE